MQFCSACQKSPATISIMDLSGGAVTDQQHFCGPCAENLGLVQPKVPMKMSAELLEDLLSSIKTKTGTGTTPTPTDVCPGCGLQLQQFKSNGRLGCPRCYETFRDELVPLLQRVHESASHRGRLPGQTPVTGPTPPTDEDSIERQTMAQIRLRLDEAVREEHYEEAARLRDELRRAEHKSNDSEGEAS